MRRRPRMSAPLVFAGLYLLIAATSAHSQCFCNGCTGGSSLLPSCPKCNVAWQAEDSIAACPAGDSVLMRSPHTTHPHPSRLRITVHYEDNFCNPRVGVAPESIYVTYQIISGNLKVNDKGTNIYADDSTDGYGNTRITIPSFSGCGKVRIRLFVSGIYIGVNDRVVRTTDFDADGRTLLGSDCLISTCDVGYDPLSDCFHVNNHEKHWRRNALHGTPVRRTNLCEASCAVGVPYNGASVSFWSPNGRWISFTIGVKYTPTLADCKVYLAASDPKDGNYLRQFTFDTDPDSNFRDYDPSWSPLEDQIVFDRSDWKILGKGIPGVAGVADTVLFLVTASGSLFDRGDLTPALSPNGQWVAFSRKDQQTKAFNLWKIKTTGGGAVQLTNTLSVADFYPRWSPDGKWITFDREFASIPGLAPPHAIYKVKDNGDSLQAVYLPDTSTTIAATPAYSADGLIVTGAIGTRSMTVKDTRTHTLDPALSSAQMKPILNYPDPQFAVIGNNPLLSPVLSPDGTRLQLNAAQVWVARRNMSLPPRITQVGTQGVVDSTARVFINAIQGLQTTITITSTDTEGDTRTCAAYFLEDGMTFDPGTCTLTWMPSAPIGSKFYVKFQVTTPSGGTDVVIAVLTVVSSLRAGPERAGLMERPDGPNPTRGRFALTASLIPGANARLTVFDLGGRQIALVRGPAGTQLVWEGRDRSGALVAPGVYPYRMEVGKYHRQEGKVVVVR